MVGTTGEGEGEGEGAASAAAGASALALRTQPRGHVLALGADEAQRLRLLKFIRRAEAVDRCMSFIDQAAWVNKASAAAPAAEQVGVELSPKTLWRFMRSLGAKVAANTTKPFLTAKNLEERLEHFKERIELARAGNVLECHLDEKWFYTNSRRRKRKLLKRQPGEPEFYEGTDIKIGVDEPEKSKSRRFATKAMFLGVVAKPLPRRRYNGRIREAFNGRIALRRVSEKKVCGRSTNTITVLPNVKPNEVLRSTWRQYVSSTDTADQMKTKIKAQFPAVDQSTLVLQVRQTGTRSANAPKNPGGQFQHLFPLKGDSTLATAPGKLKHSVVTLDDIELVKVHRIKGQEYDEDCNCKGPWLLKVLEEEIGPAIRAAFTAAGYTATTPIRLQMDQVCLSPPTHTHTHAHTRTHTPLSRHRRAGTAARPWLAR